MLSPVLFSSPKQQKERQEEEGDHLNSQQQQQKEEAVPRPRSILKSLTSYPIEGELSKSKQLSKKKARIYSDLVKDQAAQ